MSATVRSIPISLTGVRSPPSPRALDGDTGPAGSDNSGRLAHCGPGSVAWRCDLDQAPTNSDLDRAPARRQPANNATGRSNGMERLNQRQPPCWSRWRVKGIPPAERSGRGAGRGPAWRRHSGARSLSLAAPPRRYAAQAHSYRYGSIRLRQRTIRRRTLGCCGKSRGRPDRHGSLPR